MGGLKIQKLLHEAKNSFEAFLNDFENHEFEEGFEFKDFDWFVRKQQQLLENIYIFGKPGIGKTHFAQTLISGRGKYVKWYQLINKAIEKETLDLYFKTKILVIDDFLSKKPTEFNINLFYEIIDYRLENGLQTIITTNYSPKEFQNILKSVGTDNHLCERISSRMNLFKFYNFVGEDFRKGKLDDLKKNRKGKD